MHRFSFVLALCAMLVVFLAPQANAQGDKLWHEEADIKLAERPELTSLKLVPYAPTTVYQARRIAWPGDSALVAGGGVFELKDKNGRPLFEGEGIYTGEGLTIEFKTDNNLVRQVTEMVQGKLHFLRVTIGQAVMAAPLFEKLGTDLVVFVQLTWSTGGDVIVARVEVKSLADLKEIWMMQYGPHPEFFAKAVKDAEGDLSKIKIHWMKELTTAEPVNGKVVSVPQAIEAGAVAGTVISPDANALLGAEGVSGYHDLANTGDSPWIIADVLVVRGDFYDSQREVCRKFFRATVKSQEAVYEAHLNKAQQPKRFNAIMAASAPALFDKTDPAEAEGALPDCTFAFGGGNRYFFTGRNPNGLVNFSNGRRLVEDVVDSFTKMGLIAPRRDGKFPIRFADWDFNTVQEGFKYPDMMAGVQFDVEKTNQAITAQVASETGSIDALLSKATRSIQFEPNQNDFDGEQYIAAYEDLIQLAQANAGSKVNIQGLADASTAEYFKRYGDAGQKAKVPSLEKDLENDSYERAKKVLATAFAYWDAKGYAYNPDQFVATGSGGKVFQVDPQTVLPAMAEAVRIGRDGNKARAQSILDTQVKAVIAPNRVVLFRVQRVDSETSSIDALLGDGK